MTVSFTERKVAFRSPPFTLRSVEREDEVRARRLRVRLFANRDFASLLCSSMRLQSRTAIPFTSMCEYARVFARAADVGEESERPLGAVERERRIREEFADVFAEEIDSAPRWEDQQATLVRIPSVDLRVQRPSHAAMHAVISQSEEERQFISRHFRKLIRAGLLEPSQSVFNAPVFCVEKDRASPNPDKWYRAVFNFKPINK